MVFIYTLKDPITKKYMYVGKSVNPEKRFKQHLYHSKKRKTYSQIWVNNLLNDGYRPIMEVIDSCSSNLSTKKEKEWILNFFNENKSLTNLTYIPNKDDRNPDYSINSGNKKSVSKEINYLKSLGSKEIVKLLYKKHEIKKARIENVKINNQKYYDFIKDMKFDTVIDRLIKFLFLSYSLNKIKNEFKKDIPNIKNFVKKLSVYSFNNRKKVILGEISFKEYSQSIKNIIGIN